MKPNDHTKLTEKSVRAAKPDTKGRVHLWDSDLPGFGLRVYPSGARSFVFRYTVRNGASRRRLMVLGEWGTLTVAKARKRAEQLRGQVLEGRDPLGERRRNERDITFREFGKLYLKRHAKPRKKTAGEDERRLIKYLYPAFGSRQLSEITRAHVANLHARIGENRPVEANRVVQLLKAILEKAREWGYVEEGTANPAKRVSLHRERGRERWLRPEEIRRLMEAVRQEDDPYFRVFVPLLLLTGLRKSELLSAKWKDVDLDRGEIVLHETKTGGEQVRRLSDPALGLLASLPTGSPWLFPGNGKSHRKDFKRAWDRVRGSKSAGLSDVTIHDLRRTAGSFMAQAGVPIQVVGEVLGHSHPSVTRLYARLSEQNEKEALETLGERLSGLLGMERSPTESNAGVDLKEQLRELVEEVNGEDLAARLRELVADLGPGDRG